MADGERVLVNRFSGKVMEFGGDAFDPASHRLSLFKGRMVGLVRWAEANRCEVYFVTLTVRDPSTMDTLVLNGLMSFLRWRFTRANMPFRYVWVLEPQMSRYEETGVLAPHWHIAIACPMGALPDVQYLKAQPIGKRYHLVADGLVVKQSELYKRWGNGQTLCQPARGSVMDYMAKYMAKALAVAGLFGHRFGSSMMTWWRVSQWAFDCIRLFWLANMDVLRVWFTRGDKGRILHFQVTDGEMMECYDVPSPWVAMERPPVIVSL
jgi:hypothetical protein